MSCRALALVGLLAAGQALAQTAGSPLDTVFLQDGTQMDGTVVREEPGKFVVLRLPDGREVTLSFQEVKRVVKAARPATAGSPAGATAPAPPPATPATVERSGDQVTAETTEDCARDPSTERCKRRSGATVGPGGAGAGISFERRVLIKEPPSTVVRFTIEGGVLYGTGTGDIKLHIIGGGGAIGAKVLTGGGPLPGTGGGSWSGVSIDPRANFHGAGIILPDQNTGAGFTTGGFSAGLSYQWLTFGKMDPIDLKQSGFGVNIGYTGGLQLTRVYSAETGPIEAAFSHGPTVGLLFPEYNAGTSKLIAGFVNFFVLPTGDFLFLMVNGGGAF